MIYLVVYILVAVLTGVLKAWSYVTNIPVESRPNVRVMFISAWLVATILAPLVIIESIIGGVKYVKFRK